MRTSAGYFLGMAMALAVATFILIAIGAAELVRFLCRRMLTTPVRRRPAVRRMPAVQPRAATARPALRTVQGDAAAAVA